MIPTASKKRPQRDTQTRHNSSLSRGNGKVFSLSLFLFPAAESMEVLLHFTRRCYPLDGFGGNLKASSLTVRDKI